MAEEQFQASGNWWETPARNSETSSFGGWQQQQQPQHHTTMSASASSSVVFHDTQKLQPPHDSAATSGDDPNLHMMGLALSSRAMDWNQASLLRDEKGSEGSSSNTTFRSMLQENLSTSNTNFQQETQQVHWRQEKLFSTETSSNINRGFSLEQTQFSPQYSSCDSNITSQGLPCSGNNFQLDSFGNPSILQGLLGGDQSNQPQQPMNFLPYSTSYGLSSNELVPSWSNKVPQFLRASPPKQQSQTPSNSNQLHFTNNAPFWNASEVTTIKDAPSSFFPPFSSPNFDAQTKNICEGRESSGVVKKSNSEPAPKRARNETPSPMPAFKVRKEKMGDRITALQQLVSPFGKTDTASVLSEAIEYIKFLHEQVTVLSTPYMKSGAPAQPQQSTSGKSKETDQGPKQDLRSRGLCLVPVSSTFPMTHEPTVEYWTPTFGGTYR